MSKKAFTIQFTPEAIRQIERIAGWYEEQLPGLGNRFKRMLKAELIKVKQNPLSRSVRYNNVHFAVPYRFPYAAHYTVGGNKITIHAVFGFSEAPDKWEITL